MHFGLGPNGEEHSVKDIAQHFAISRTRVAQIESRALSKLRHPSRSALLKEFIKQTERLSPEPEPVPVEIVPVIEKVKKLTPALIEYLQENEKELDKIRWDVFEHLIAEFFASWGFEDVRLVGRNSMTSADVFAAYTINPAGTKVKYFIEVKRRKDKIGVQIIDQVYGAMISEREKFGWHAAMIVSIVGFTDFEKYTRDSLALRGVELKDRDDLLVWLKNYKRNKNGLWLPAPVTDFE